MVLFGCHAFINVSYLGVFSDVVSDNWNWKKLKVVLDRYLQLVLSMASIY